VILSCPLPLQEIYRVKKYVLNFLSRVRARHELTLVDLVQLEIALVMHGATAIQI
jgi:hypothetical protein